MKQLSKRLVRFSVIPPLAFAVGGVLFLAHDSLSPSRDCEPSVPIRACEPTPLRPLAAVAVVVVGEPSLPAPLPCLAQVVSADEADVALALGPKLQGQAAQGLVTPNSLSIALCEAKLPESRIVLLHAFSVADSEGKSQTIADRYRLDPSPLVQKECLVLLASMGESTLVESELLRLANENPERLVQLSALLPRIPALRSVVLRCFNEARTDDLRSALAWALASRGRGVPNDVVTAAGRDDASSLPVTRGLIRALPRSRDEVAQLATSAKHRPSRNLAAEAVGFRIP